MAYGTITQPVFWVDTLGELDVAWPDRSIAWCKANKRLYEFNDGIWSMVNDIAAIADWVPRVWLNGTRKSLVKKVAVSGTVSGGAGVVTFNLTDSSGNAILSNVYKETANIWLDNQASFNWSSWTLAADKKSVSVKISQPIVSALVIIYANAANGTTVYLSVEGD